MAKCHPINFNALVFKEEKLSRSTQGNKQKTFGRLLERLDAIEYFFLNLHLSISFLKNSTILSTVLIITDTIYNKNMCSADLCNEETKKIRPVNSLCH